MAISREHHSLTLFQEALRQGISLPGSRWAFLGNQRLRGCPRENPDPAAWREWWGFNFPDPPEKLANGKLHSIAPWLEFFGAAECVMLDSNGKDGCLQHDLNHPVEEKYFGQYDVVANFGTSEHVEPDQMPVFKTVHDLCKPGGLMLHAVPSVGCNRHGKWKYPAYWMSDLIDSQQYKVIEFDVYRVSHNRGDGQHLYFVGMFRKMSDAPWRPDYWNDPPQSER